MKPGVINVVSGYSGGNTMDPTYDEVSAGDTGHAEVVKIEFDPKKIAIDEILRLFWLAHDPTTPDQQGYDFGTQYRSIILYKGKQQKDAVEASLKFAKKQWGKNITTEIKVLHDFYDAEEFHQNYFSKNLDQPYCQAVIAPKVKKLAKELK